MWQTYSGPNNCGSLKGAQAQNCSEAQTWITLANLAGDIPVSKRTPIEQWITDVTSKLDEIHDDPAGDAVVQTLLTAGIGSLARGGVGLVSGLVDILGSSAAEEGAVAADEGGSLAEDAARLKCSFTPATMVLVAADKAIPISALKVGDKVLATDTSTGKSQAETVTAVIIHRDSDLYDLRIKAGNRTAVIHTTSNHPFWVPAVRGNAGHWAEAGKLRYGTPLRMPSGGTATVIGGWTPKVTSGWMWDITVPGNNDHDFYVDTAAAPVLVHNCGGPDLDALSQSGMLPIGAQGMTKAGASLAQHAAELGYDDLAGGAAIKNLLGQDLLDEILTNPGTRVIKVTSGNFAGGLRFISPDYAGATFSPSGVFRYFGYYGP